MTYYQTNPVVAIIVFTLIFYLNGAFFTQQLLEKKQWPLKFFANVSIGFGLVLLLCFFLALFQFYTVASATVVLLVIPVFYLVNLAKQGAIVIDVNKLTQGLFSHVGLVAILLVLFLPNMYQVFFPDYVSDAVRYHLPYAKFYAENHGLMVNEYMRYPVFSHNINMAFSLGYLYLGSDQGEVLARMFIGLSLFLIITGLYSLVVDAFNKIMAIIACVILLQVGSLKTFMVVGYIDLGLSLFVFASVTFLYLWQKENNQKWLYFSAMMLGIAVGSKYLALIWVLPLTLWVFLSHFKWKQALQFMGLALLVGSPWYIRNLIIAGNPIHPFAQEFFGYWLWTERDVVVQKQDLLIGHGVRRIFTNFIQLPWLLGTDKYFVKSFMGWFLIAGIPLTVCCLFMKKYFRYMAAFVLLNLAFWFYTSQILRYLFAILPLLAIFAAYPFGTVLNRLKPDNYLPLKSKQIMVSIIIVSSVIYLGYSVHLKNQKQPLPSNTIEWNNWKQKKNKWYQFAKLLNERQAKKVFKVSKAFIQNDFNGVVMGDWFGKAHMATFATESKSTDDVKAKMKEFDVKYLLVNKKRGFMGRLNELLRDSQEFEILLDTKTDTLFYLKTE